ncbi:MAG TPA: diaminopimelate epimerase [Nevskia sp.]|jgi:diaminopimelate epimerase|nr:diaminopimelate epimerase [Nevskia sp.]
MNLPFAKMHGLGNDFVVIDATRAPARELLRAPSPALLSRLTDRRFGVGCDQVLLIEPAPAPDFDFGYRIFNADGSEVGQCGNGSRCLARYVREHRMSDKRDLRVRTSTTQMELHLLDDGRVRVNMGAPRFEPADVPMIVDGGRRAPEYRISLADGSTLAGGAVSMGNPHAVFEVADVDTAPVAQIGEELQHHPAFPQRVNAGFIQFIDGGHARLRVYERGVGETLACGSGACAAMAVGRLWGKLGARAEIQVRGGTLQLEWGGEGQPVWMTGPAETVYEGSLEWPK